MNRRIASTRSGLGVLCAAALVLAQVAAAAGDYSPIEKTVEGCKAAGIGSPPGLKPVQSDLKKQTSLVGMAYLNYIYQNDLLNEHFCQAMQLMHAQVPTGTVNPFVALFTAEHGAKTMTALADVQLAFDHSIARSNPAAERIEASLKTLRGIVE